MKPVPRTPRPSRRLALGSAAVSSVCGLVLLVAGPTTSAPPLRGLVPATVVDHALRELPIDARNVRFNGLYGSGHAGVWEFVAHLTWRDSTGALQGGRVHLPETAGQHPLETEFDVARLQHEERISWAPGDIARTLRRIEEVDAPLALVEFVPDYGVRPAPVVACRAERAGPSRCVSYQRGDPPAEFGDELFEVPYGRALSVQRRGAPVES